MSLSNLTGRFVSALRAVIPQDNYATFRAFLQELENSVAKIDPGQPSYARFTVGTNFVAANADTVTVGDDVYEFLAAGDTVADDAYIGVLVGGTAALSLANFLDAINGDVAAATGILKSDASAAETNGTEAFKAISTAGATASLLLLKSVTQGGAIQPGVDTTTVACATTAADTRWDRTAAAATAINPGRAARQYAVMMQQVVPNAAQVAAGAELVIPFFGHDGEAVDVASFIVIVRTSAGALKEAYTDTAAADDNTVVITLGGGGGDIAATDVVTVLATTVA